MENMNYEFKDIATVDMVETVADTANVLIEEDGVIKRAPKSEVGGDAGVTSWNDLTDKPFEEKQGMITYVSLSNEEFPASDGDYSVEISLDVAKPLEIGKEYSVKWNDSEYSLVCFEDAENGCPTLGNTVLFDNTNGDYPFNIIYFSYNEKLYIKTTECEYDANVYHSLEIAENAIIVKTLDEKYIPETISRTNHNHSWKDIGEKINWLLSETEYTGGTILMSESIKVGKTYIISVDDYEYEGVASEEYNGIEYAPCVSIKGAGTIERNELTLYVSEGSIVSVREVELKQLDEKYLPDSVKCGSGAIIITGSGSLDSSDYEAVLDMDSDDIINLIEQDKYPILKITINSGGSHFNSGDKAIMTYQGNKADCYVFTSVLMTKVIRLYIESGRGTYADFNIADDV